MKHDPAPPSGTPAEQHLDANHYGRNFALLYDYAFNGWIRAFAPSLREYLSELVPSDACLLDLCCGTGETSRAMLAQNWRIVGLDQSQDMLDVAREKHAAAIADNQISFSHARAEAFSWPTLFDVCICVDGALNHLPDTRALQDCFSCVSKVLQPGAPFVFDLLGAEHFARWEETRISEDTHHLLVRRGSWDATRNEARLEILGGIGGAALWRVRETLVSRAFSDDEVRAALDAAHLALTPCTLSDIRPTGRKFFHAIKL